MSDSPTTAVPGSRALVLGGGGVAGIAWETGLVGGLLAAGVDLEDGTTYGTSAGAVVGTLLRAGRLRPGAVDSLLGELSSSLGARLGETGGRGGWAAFVTTMARAARDGSDPQARRALLGRPALADPGSLDEEAWLALVGEQLPRDWPEGQLGVTAVDVEDGDFRVFRREDGVPLAAAVAASCALPSVYPPVTVGGRRWMDGGMRSTTNADAALGASRVLVLSCGFEDPANPFGPALPHAVRALEESGARVLVVSPSPAALAAFGGDVLDPATQVPSYLAGAEQARLVLDRVRDLWHPANP